VEVLNQAIVVGSLFYCHDGNIRWGVGESENFCPNKVRDWALYIVALVFPRSIGFVACTGLGF
jgi:hypothetical protein